MVLYLSTQCYLNMIMSLRLKGKLQGTIRVKNSYIKYAYYSPCYKTGN